MLTSLLLPWSSSLLNRDRDNVRVLSRHSHAGDLPSQLQCIALLWIYFRGKSPPNAKLWAKKTAAKAKRER